MFSSLRVGSTVRFLLALWLTSLRATMARRIAFVTQIVFMALNNFIVFTFWWLLFQRVPSIRGHSLGDVAVLFGVVSGGFGVAVTLAGGMRYLGRMIDDGDLDSFVSQPKPTLLYALGARTHASGVGDLLSGIALIALSGKIGLPGAPLVAIAIVASALAFVATGTLFYSLAFWFGKTDGVARQLFDMLITFSLYPERLFGGALKLVLFTLLPSAYVGYLPARFIQTPTVSGLLVLFAAATAYSLLAVYVFERGLRRYCSGSRFGVAG
jgi:ABC-2 type transport system permease protein